MWAQCSVMTGVFRMGGLGRFNHWAQRVIGRGRTCQISDAGLDWNALIIQAPGVRSERQDAIYDFSEGPVFPVADESPLKLQIPENHPSLIFGLGTGQSRFVVPKEPSFCTCAADAFSPKVKSSTSTV